MPVTNGFEAQVQTLDGEPRIIGYRIAQLSLVPNPSDWGYVLRGLATPVDSDEERVAFAIPVQDRDMMRSTNYCREIALRISEQIKFHLFDRYGLYAEVVAS